MRMYPRKAKAKQIKKKTKFLFGISRAIEGISPRIRIYIKTSRIRNNTAEKKNVDLFETSPDLDLV